MENQVVPLNITDEETAPCCHVLTITAPSERGRHCYQRTLQKALRTATHPGFRRGKVPEKVFLALHRGEVVQAATEALVGDAVKEAVGRLGRRIVLRPELVGSSAEAYREGADYTFQVRLEVDPEFELPDYAGFHLTRVTEAVEDQEVEALLKRWIDGNGTFEPVDRPSAPGDMVKATYSSAAPDDLREMRDCRYLLNAEKTWVTLGKPEMFPGVGTFLAGLSAGDEKDVSVEFPADYWMAALRGRTIGYHFVVHEVLAWNEPGITDALLKRFNAKDEADLRAIARRELAAEHERSAARRFRQDVLDALCEGQDFPLPPRFLERLLAGRMRDRRRLYLQSGGDEKEWADKKAGIEAETAKELQRSLRLSFILQAIAAKANIKLEGQNLLDLAVEYAAQQGRRFEEVVATFKNMCENGRQEELLTLIVNEKAIAHVMYAAQVTVVDRLHPQTDEDNPDQTREDAAETAAEPVAAAESGGQAAAAEPAAGRG